MVNVPIVAVVRGGYYRAVFIPKAIVLDASTSTDSNLLVTADQGLSFEWSCTITYYDLTFKAGVVAICI